MHQKKILDIMSLHSLVAQPVERAAVNRNVASSSLAQGARIQPADFSGSYLTQDPVG